MLRMTGASLRERLEQRQVPIYVVAVLLAAVAALTVPGLAALEPAINPALALMLFVTFLQVPLAELGQTMRQVRFMGALLTANFVAIPLLVAVLAQLLPPEPMLRLGVFLVLLTPCIDYVVTFAHLGRADAKALLAATPLLLILQMMLLPIYLGTLLGPEARSLVQAGPFFHAFLWLIAVPLALAGLVQAWSRLGGFAERARDGLGLLPVPATALVLFVVAGSVMPRLGRASESVALAIPFYLAFAVLAPTIGWFTGRLFRLSTPSGRAVAFSAATRNSLVVLPLALAVPGAIPILPAVIVAQTLVELLSELVYVRFISKLGAAPTVQPT